jgi:hypothetical protein
VGSNLVLETIMAGWHLLSGKERGEWRANWRADRSPRSDLLHAGHEAPAVRTPLDGFSIVTDRATPSGRQRTARRFAVMTASNIRFEP